MHQPLRKPFILTLAVLTLSAAGTSCTSFQTTHNSRTAREHLTEDLEDQIMFNLIRARNGLPFAHYDVVNIHSEAGSRISPEVNAGYSVEDAVSPSRSIQTSRGANGLVTGVVTTVAAASAVATTVTKPFTYGISGERNNTVTVDVEPTYDEPEIYEAYVEFLNYTESTPPAKPGSGGPPTMVTSLEKKTVVTDKATGKVTETVETTTQPQVDSPTAELGIHFGSINTVAETEKRPKSGYIPRTLKKWEGKWYYIPDTYRPQFSKLCMKLVARGAAFSDGSVTIVASPSTKTTSGEKTLKRLESTFKSLRALGL